MSEIEPLNLSKVNFYASPNKTKRGKEEDPLYIVLHHTGAGSFNNIVKWLCDPMAKASAHYVLGKNGEVAQLVNTRWQSWHAGRAKYGDKLRNNSHSIGIEICNIGIMDKEDGGYYYEQCRKMKKYTGNIEPVYSSIKYEDYKVLSGYSLPYPEKQRNKLVALCKGIIKKYPGITKENIVTHYQIAIPCGRKNDPFGLDVEEIRNQIFA